MVDATILEAIMFEAMSRILGMTFIGLSTALTACAAGPHPGNVQDSVSAAQGTLESLQNDPMIGPPLKANLKNAKAILIATPRVTRGVVLARGAGTQKWFGPAFYQLTNIAGAGGRSGGMGFTVGEQELELVAVAMNDKALNWLLAPTMPGSGGINMAEVSGNQRPPSADMLLFSRSQVVQDGKRVGQLSHTVVSIDKAANESYYGRSVTPEDILVKHSVNNPNAESLQKAVAAAAGQQ